MHRVLDRSGALTGLALAFAASLALAGSASAFQFTPSATARLHTITSGEPGAAWFTAPSGQASYASGTGLLSITGVVTEINYFDPLNGSCSADAGSNCTHSFVTPLDFSLSAQFLGLGVTATGNPGEFLITLNFGSAGTPDLLVTDPADSNNTVLAANWTSGTFQGTPTPGLQIDAIYDSIGGTVTFDPTSIGFLLVDGLTPYASLFESGGTGIGLNISSFFSFAPSLNAIAASIIGSGVLPSFTSQGQGQVFRVTSGDFVVPEPTTALLLGLGLAGLAMTGGRRQD